MVINIVSRQNYKVPKFLSYESIYELYMLENLICKIL